MGITPGLGEIMSDGSLIVTANGSYILPSGVLVLSEADYLLVLKGELDPHALLHDHGQIQLFGKNITYKKTDIRKSQISVFLMKIY